MSTLVFWKIQRQSRLLMTSRIGLQTSDDLPWSTIDCIMTSQFAPLSCSHYKVTGSCDQSITNISRHVEPPPTREGIEEDKVAAKLNQVVLQWASGRNKGLSTWLACLPWSPSDTRWPADSAHVGLAVWR